MALPPKPQLRKRSDSSVATAEGKAEQRARNGTRSGSSGRAKVIRDLDRLEWDDVAEDVEHVADIAARFAHTQMGANGYVVATLNSPGSYIYDYADVQLECTDGLAIVRVYKVSMEKYLERQRQLREEQGIEDGYPEG